MSALARWFNAKGYRVGGYDLTPSPLTDELKEEGIAVHFEDLGAYVPVEFKEKDTLIIYTPAVPNTHGELNFFIRNGFDVKKRSEVLGMLTKSFFTIAVAGTHGKTTTSSMVAHVLKDCGKNVFAFIGGISRNYNSNLLLGDQEKGDEIMVVEADEYDRSFLQLHPDMAVVTSMDADHLDIYGNEDYVKKSFHAFARQIKKGGFLTFRNSLPLRLISENLNELTFGEVTGDYKAVNIQVKDGAFEFDIEGKEKVKGFRMKLPGRHNIMNATAAFIIARQLGIDASEIKKALHSFQGVKRRFDVVCSTESVTYIDDYAHHPAEIEATLEAVRELHPGKNITVVFQPHLYSRTRDFMEEFASSLSIADQVILLPIYPAREEPIKGISSEVLLGKITSANRDSCQKDELLDKIKSIDTEVLITMGAGDIDRFVEPIKNILDHEEVV